MGNKPKLGIVLAKAPGYSETFLVNKIKGLKDDGFEVILFTDRKSHHPNLLCKEYSSYVLPENALIRWVKVFYVIAITLFLNPYRTWMLYTLEFEEGTNRKGFFKTIFRSAHIINHELDFLHFGFATMGIGRENLGRVLQAHVSASFRGYDIGIFPLKHPSVYDKLWVRLDKVHTISDDLYNKAIRLGLPQSIPVVKISPAIDVNKFLFPNRQSVDFTELRILTVGRLEWKKGLGVAIDAMIWLKSWNVKFKYTIVGTGTEIDRLKFNRYQGGVEEEIEFVGVKNQDEVIAIMKRSDIYIQPSLQEGFCNAVLEAQANGLLCVVSDAEGLSENVLHNETGWVIPRGNALALANKIREVINLPLNEIKQIRDRAISRVRKDFDLINQRQKFTQFFR